MVFLVVFIITSKRTTGFSLFLCCCYDLRTTIKLTVKKLTVEINTQCVYFVQNEYCFTLAQSRNIKVLKLTGMYN
jgi:hypothetical protein